MRATINNAATATKTQARQRGKWRREWDYSALRASPFGAALRALSHPASSHSDQSPQIAKNLGSHYWRRGWDSNPRTPVKMLLEFQSSAFDRSATSPINHL